MLHDIAPRPTGTYCLSEANFYAELLVPSWPITSDARQSEAARAADAYALERTRLHGLTESTSYYNDHCSLFLPSLLVGLASTKDYSLQWVAFSGRIRGFSSRGNRSRSGPGLVGLAVVTCVVLSTCSARAGRPSVLEDAGRTEREVESPLLRGTNRHPETWRSPTFGSQSVRR
jgi:hypothetical protein